MTADPEEMRKLLTRMMNGGIDHWWKDAIVRVLDGGKAPDSLDDDAEAVERHRNWMKALGDKP